MRIYRLEDGKKWPPALNQGRFELGDPQNGRDKHKVKNSTFVQTEEEAIQLLRRGYSIRIETTSRPSLIRRNLYIDGIPLTT